MLINRGWKRDDRRISLRAAGLLLWAAILFHEMRSRRDTEHRGDLRWLFFFPAAFHVVGLLARLGSHFTATGFCRVLAPAMVHLDMLLDPAGG
ncbi:MAG: hypothetical protein IT160_18150 [Bryobacterales bacterium]|nr:hypothetical protein [Bryobacterales bacterium]